MVCLQREAFSSNLALLDGWWEVWEEVVVGGWGGCSSSVLACVRHCQVTSTIKSYSGIRTSKSLRFWPPDSGRNGRRASQYAHRVAPLLSFFWFHTSLNMCLASSPWLTDESNIYSPDVVSAAT